MDRFEVPKCYGAFLLNEGGGGVNIHDKGQVVRDGGTEIDAGEVIGGDSSGTDQIQGVSFTVGGEIDVLSEIEKV